MHVYAIVYIYINIIYIYIYARIWENIIFDNPKSATCPILSVVFKACLMVNLLDVLMNLSRSQPRVEEFEMAKNYAFSYSPENRCILGDLSLRHHEHLNGFERINSGIWSTTRKLTCLYIYIYVYIRIRSYKYVSTYIHILSWTWINSTRHFVPVLSSCLFHFSRFFLWLSVAPAELVESVSGGSGMLTEIMEELGDPMVGILISLEPADQKPRFLLFSIMGDGILL